MVVGLSPSGSRLLGTSMPPTIRLDADDLLTVSLCDHVRAGKKHPLMMLRIPTHVRVIPTLWVLVGLVGLVALIAIVVLIVLVVLVVLVVGRQLCGSRGSLPHSRLAHPRANVRRDATPYQRRQEQTQSGQ